MTFKALSYNIKYGGGDRLPLIAEVIRKQQPDVVALLEANSQSNAESLASKLGMHLAYGQANSEFAVAWLSDQPIQHNKNHQLPGLAKTLLEITIVWKEVVLTLWATHLIAGRTAAAAAQRTEEVQIILDVISSVADRSHLLVGDFNAIHPEDGVGTLPVGEKEGYIARQPIQLILEAGYIDCYRKLHARASGYTYPSHHPWLRIDHIFASRAMAVWLRASEVVGGVETKQASDHLPIWAEFQRN